MRMMRYEELLRLDYSEVRRITSAGQPFMVVADASLCERIQKFLANEHQFRCSARTLADRVRYVRGGIHGLRLPNLLPIWNRAMMDGFVVREVISRGTCEIVFEKNSTRAV